MKAAMNGVLNASVLDGWWDEAVSRPRRRFAEVGFGWAIGDRDESRRRGRPRRADASELYRLLDEEVVPTFHDRDEDGLPRRWLTMMQDAIALLAPAYSTHRMVADYAVRYGVTPG
jgi:glycogen phosphorylase